MINVVCLKWGTKFGPEYVNNLLNGIRKNTTLPIKLHCFTDNATGITVPGVKIHPLLQNGVETWWNKLYLFSKDLPIPVGEKIVFFDLDTLITGNVDYVLAADASSMVVLRDFYTGIAESVKGDNNVGSGLMSWIHGSYTYIWDRFIKNPKKVVESLHPHGDQRWIQMNVHRRVYWQDILPGNVVSFKVHCRNGLPKNASVVCYHGRPSIPESITQHTKTKWDIKPAPWVEQYWPTKHTPLVKTYFTYLDPKKIFGMVGRCGGGYNTVWEDWSPLGRLAREQIIKEFEDGINKICGHYAKLEESIIREGFRNPLIVSRGKVVTKPSKCIPPEILNKSELDQYYLEGTTGGSRLWVAQKHSLMVPCIVNDYTGDDNIPAEIQDTASAAQYFKDQPAKLVLDPIKGLVEPFDQNKVGYHLGVEWSEEKVVKERAPLWVSTMNKYGYYVDRLTPAVNAMLYDAGIDQKRDIEKIYGAVSKAFNQTS